MAREAREAREARGAVVIAEGEEGRVVAGVVAEEAGGVEGRGGDLALANCELVGTFPLELGCGVLVGSEIICTPSLYSSTAMPLVWRVTCVADLRKRAVARSSRGTPHRRCRTSARVRDP